MPACQHVLIWTAWFRPEFEHLKCIKPPPEPKALTLQGKHHFTRIKVLDSGIVSQSERFVSDGDHYSMPASVILRVGLGVPGSRCRCTCW
jgi:hypothetical protein